MMKLLAVMFADVRLNKVNNVMVRSFQGKL